MFSIFINGSWEHSNYISMKYIYFLNTFNLAYESKYWKDNNTLLWFIDSGISSCQYGSISSLSACCEHIKNNDVIRKLIIHGFSSMTKVYLRHNKDECLSTLNLNCNNKIVNAMTKDLYSDKTINKDIKKELKKILFNSSINL